MIPFLRLSVDFPWSLTTRCVPQRLAGGEWFTSRISACGLLPTSYSLSPEGQKDTIRGLFQTLSQDDTPMVRRAAAECLGPLAEVADAHTLSSTVAPTFLKLTQDGAP